MQDAGAHRGPPAPLLAGAAAHLDARLQARLAALNSSGRHITNLTQVNGTTVVEVDVSDNVSLPAKRMRPRHAPRASLHSAHHAQPCNHGRLARRANRPD